MRTFAILTFVLIASLSGPFLAVADTNCTTTVNGQVVTGLLVNGVCSVTTSQIQTGAGNNQVQVGAGNLNNTGSNIYLVNPLKGVDCSSGNGDCLMAFLQNILAFIIRIGTIVVILMLVYVGYKFVVAQGNPGEIEKAKQMLLWTIIGALILLGSQAIAMSIKATVTSLGG